MSTMTKWSNPFGATQGWNPWLELNEMQNRLENRFVPPVKNGHRDDTFALAGWIPVVDVAEDNKEYIIKAELPGIKKEDVKVTLENGVLSISGERKVEKEEKDKTFHHVERTYGTFLRRFNLPDTASVDKVNAEFKDGMLQIRLPKHEAARPKHVDVKVQ